MSETASRVPDAARWQVLCHQAESGAGVWLEPEISDYLVTLLLRCFRQDGSVAYVLQSERLECGFEVLPEEPERLQVIADQCLVIAGLIPEWAEGTGIRIGQFIRLGQQACSKLSVQQDGWMFTLLEHRFVELVEVLQILREQQDGAPCMSPLQAHELWLECGRFHALRVLQRSTRAHPLPGNEVMM